MARTKAEARRGPEGDAFRENAKRKAESQDASSGAGRGGGSKRRKRNRNHGDAEVDGREKESVHDNAQEGNGAKRRKSSDEGEGAEETAPHNDAEDGTARTTVPAEASMEKTSGAASGVREKATGNALLVPIFAGLENTHRVTTMSIISSSNIGKKVSRVLEVLGVASGTGAEKDDEGKEGEREEGKRKKQVVMLYAKAPVVSKVVSVAEIAKRELAKEGGKWFSYCVVEEVVLERWESAAHGKGEGRKGKGEETEEDPEAGESEEKEAFDEPMKTPFERALEREGKPKVRAVPVMSLYLSRVGIEGLRIAHGEQTNAQSR